MNGLDPLDDSGGSGKTKERRMEEKRIAATPEKIQQLRELCDKYGTGSATRFFQGLPGHS